MWPIAIVLIALIGGTLAMGVWFISVPLALILVSLPLLGSLWRRVNGNRQVDEFRAQADYRDPTEPEQGRDHSTLYEPAKQDKPPAAY